MPSHATPSRCATSGCEFRRWLDGLIERYAERVVTLDAPACRLAGRISDESIAAGRHPGFPDVAIAALAQGADLTVLTRNARHFAPLGVPCIDPFGHLPD